MSTASSIIVVVILALYFILLLSYASMIKSQRQAIDILRDNLVEAFNMISQVADANKQLAKEMKNIATELDDIAIELEIQAEKEAKASNE